MPDLSQWEPHRAIFRSFSGKTHDHRLSCGFINKSEVVEDVVNQRYDRLAMVYLLRGNGHYSDSTGVEHDLVAGDIFFRCPDRLHSTLIDPRSQWLECFISVRSEWYDLLRNIHLMVSEKPCLHVGHRPEIPNKIDALYHQLNESDTPLSNSDHEFEIVGMMRQILRSNLEADSETSLQHQQLEYAREQIRLRATEPANLETILEQSGLSYSRLRSLFQKAYKTSPGEYRIQVRMDQACALLQTGQHPIQDIADMLGYADPFAFSKQFKQRVGVPPSLFRSGH